MKKTILIGALILVFASATFAAAGPYGKRGACPLGYGPYAIDSLNLTDEQAQKIMATRQSNFAEMQEIRNKLFQKRAELRLAWMQVAPDVAKIKGLQREINELRAQQQDKRIDHRLALREILTPDQLTRYLALSSWGSRGQGGPGMSGRNFRPWGMGPVLEAIGREHGEAPLRFSDPEPSPPECRLRRVLYFSDATEAKGKK